MARTIDAVLVAVMVTVLPASAAAQAKPPASAPGGQKAAPGLGENVKKVIDEFNRGNYIDSAYKFFDVVENDNNQQNQLAAEYFAGASLHKLKFYQPAYYFFSGIVKTGPNHPFFGKAVEGLVEIADSLKDDLFIPELFMKFYTPEFSKLEAEVLNHINYMIGELAYRKGKVGEAEKFLNVIPKNSKFFTRAQYLRGVILIRAQKFTEATAAFDDILKATSSPKLDEYQAQVRHLAMMALARNYYGNGEYKKAGEHYAMIPRFDDDWLDALFEGGWSYFMLQDFGTAMGRVHTLFAPNYLETFQPETFILKATIYFYSCLYDESKGTLEAFYSRYKDMPEKLRTKVLQSQEAGPDFFFRLVAGTPLSEQNDVPMEIRKHLRSNPRFRNFVNFWIELEREKAMIEKVSTWSGSRFGTTLKGIIQSQSDMLTKVIGKWTQIRLQNLHDSLIDFLNQAQLIDFETVNEQRKLLTAVDKGREGGGARAALGRPMAASDNEYYWEFDQEFWVDELGYYNFTIRKECK
ncbi:MAG: hypothetical protein HY897_02680 [Deltaproteobacteria bacterium]|nr:hypothetical protein [Deltaproteobacteria bacterium]